MNNKTQPTPEQLQAWREEAALAYMADDIAMITTSTRQHFIAGYLRRCQETEQALKDARKQALGEAIAICHEVLAPTKQSNAEAPTAFRDAYISGVNRCINRLEPLK